MPTVRRNRARRNIAAKLDLELYEALETWAVENEIVIGAGRANISEAVGLLLEAALGKAGVAFDLEVDLHEKGYQAGRRQGLSEARTKLAKAMEQ